MLGGNNHLQPDLGFNQEGNNVLPLEKCRKNLSPLHSPVILPNFYSKRIPSSDSGKSKNCERKYSYVILENQTDVKSLSVN
jgi:hypothetical protein